jgi:hypothetical protein
VARICLGVVSQRRGDRIGRLPVLRKLPTFARRYWAKGRARVEVSAAFSIPMSAAIFLLSQPCSSGLLPRLLS